MVFVHEDLKIVNTFNLDSQILKIKNKEFQTSVVEEIEVVRFEWFYKNERTFYGIYSIPPLLKKELSKKALKKLAEILHENAFLQEIEEPFIESESLISLIPLVKNKYKLNTLSFYTADGFEKLCKINSEVYDISLKEILNTANSLTMPYWSLSVIKEVINKNDPRVLYEDDFQILWICEG